MEKKMNRHLLLFEYKKILKRKKNIIVFILLFFLVSGLLFLNNFVNQRTEMSKIENYKYQISQIEDAINRIPDNDKNLKSVKDIEEGFKYEIDLVKQQMEANKNGSWKKELELQVTLDKNLLQKLESGKVIGGYPIPVIKSRIVMNEQLISKNIEPVNEISSTKGIYFLKNIMNVLMGFTGIVLFIFIVGDILAVEFEKGTIKFLFTQGIPRSIILNCKTIVAISCSITILILVGLFSFVSGSIFWGTGTIEYPIPIQIDGLTTFISVGQYLVQCSILFIFVLIFTITLAIFLSLITNSGILAISLTIILSSVFFLGVNKYGYFASFSHFIPFSYFNIDNIIDGSLSFSLNNNNISFLFGILVLTIASVFVYSISIILIRKKEIF
jgi:ABC-2 type transport system permease protein